MAAWPSITWAWQSLLRDDGKVVRRHLERCASAAARTDGARAPGDQRHRRLGRRACAAQVGDTPKLRPLRGSHLLLPAWRLPLAQAVSLMHPHDGRPVFAYPWEGVTLVGTTDVDHGASLDAEPAITRGELDYLLAGAAAGSSRNWRWARTTCWPPLPACAR